MPDTWQPVGAPTRPFRAIDLGDETFGLAVVASQEDTTPWVVRQDATAEGLVPWQVQLVDTDGQPLGTGERPLRVDLVRSVLEGEVLTPCSMTSALSGTEALLDAAEEWDPLAVAGGMSTLPWAGVVVAAYASHAGTIYVDQSLCEGVGWEKTTSQAVSATTFTVLRVPFDAGRFKVRYVNGGTTQTTFSIQAILRPFWPWPIA